MPEKYVRDWRNWVAPAALAGTLVVALFLAVLVVIVLEAMGDKANEIDDSRAVSAAQTALLAARRRLSGTLEDNAVWQEAFIATQSQNRRDWMWTNWGSVSADYPLYDGVAVTNPDGEQLGAYFKGAEFDAVATFGEAFLRQVKTASGPQHDTIVNVFRWQGGIALVGSRALQPERNMPPGGRNNVLTMFKLITPKIIDAIASDYLLSDLHLAADKPREQLSFPLLSADGQPLAYLAWPGRNLGTRLYEEVRPTLTGALVALGVLLATSVLAGYAELLALKRLASSADSEATRDPLSGLLNRNGMIRALQTHLNGKGAAAGLTLHLIDLDGFKAVNDTWGHLVGDKLIAAVAARLSACHPGLEFVARFGGDEFALASRIALDPASVAEAALLALKEPFVVAGHTAEIGASIGYAAHTSGMDAFELIRRADMALYGAKEAGRGQCVAYGPEMDRDREAMAQLEEQLRLALDSDGLSVVFQPVVSSVDGAVVGVEALARWTAPQGPVSPDVFIALAEKSGLIFKLGQIVLQRAIHFARARPGVDIAVNVSPTQLCAQDFAESVMAVLDREGFDPRRLILEVTEGVLVESPVQARRAIEALRAIGIRFALDDFGTGYASIGTLSHFTFDRLKLDRSLVQALESEKGRAVIGATVSLAAALDIPVIVEGVETMEQAAYLRQLGCQYMQGYYFGKPMKPEEFDSLPGRLAKAG